MGSDYSPIHMTCGIWLGMKQVDHLQDLEVIIQSYLGHHHMVMDIMECQVIRSSLQQAMAFVVLTGGFFLPVSLTSNYINKCKVDSETFIGEKWLSTRIL